MRERLIEWVDAFINLAPALLAGVTVLLALGCMAVWRHRSPIHRQRLGELTILCVLAWIVLAAIPLPRPLAATNVFKTRAIPVRSPQPAPILAVAQPADTPSPMREPPSFAPVAPPDSFHWPPEAYTIPKSTRGAVAANRGDTPTATVVAPISLQPGRIPASVETRVQSLLPKSRLAESRLAESSSPELPLAESPFPASRSSASPLAESPLSALTSPGAPIGNAAPAVSPQGLDPLRALDWPRLLAVLYAGSCLLCLCWLVLGSWLLRRVVRRACPPSDWLHEAFRRLLETGRTSRTRLLISERSASAISFGVWRPTVVLPASACRPENVESLLHVLRHELAHIRQRDAWGNLLFNGAFVLLHFHPCYWWLRAQARLSSEMIADDLASRDTSQDEYATALVGFVRACRGAGWWLAGPIGVRNSPTQFSRRMEMLIRRDRSLATSSSRSWRALSLLGCVLGITLLAASLGSRATAQSVADNGEGARDQAAPVERSAAVAKQILVELTAETDRLRASASKGANADGTVPRPEATKQRGAAPHPAAAEPASDLHAASGNGLLAQVYSGTRVSEPFALQPTPAPPKSPGKSLRFIRLEHAPASSVARTLSQIFNSGEGVDFVCDERSQTIVVKDATPELLKSIEECIKVFDRPVTSPGVHPAAGVPVYPAYPAGISIGGGEAAAPYPNVSMPGPMVDGPGPHTPHRVRPTPDTFSPRRPTADEAVAGSRPTPSTQTYSFVAEMRPQSLQGLERTPDLVTLAVELSDAAARVREGKTKMPRLEQLHKKNAITTEEFETEAARFQAAERKVRILRGIIETLLSSTEVQVKLGESRLNLGQISDADRDALIERKARLKILKLILNETSEPGAPDKQGSK